MKKIYYAHPINSYDSKIEEEDIKTLSQLGFEVFNPNQKHIALGYKKSNHDMNYFKQFILSCDALAIRTTPGGHITSGVGTEADYAIKIGIPVIILSDKKTILKKLLNHQETKDYLKKHPIY